MAVGDIYCVKQFGTLYAQNTLNVYFYEVVVDAFPDKAAALFDAFNDDVLNILVDCVLDQYDIIRVEVFQPVLPSDFADGTPTNNKGTRGAAIGERASSYDAFGLRSNRSGPGTRASYKRYCGLDDDDQDANSLSAGFLGLIPVLALPGALAATIQSSAGGSTFKPIQVKHPVPLGFLPVKNLDITDWSVPYLTSQVSRRAPAGT